MSPEPVVPDFVFSQSSLQDFVDCPRRFELRYLLGVRWPAVESEPFLEAERAMQRGQRFHRLVHQFWLGTPPDLLTRGLNDPLLEDWWGAFRQYVESSGLLQAQRLAPEAALNAGLGQRLTAQYDLIAVQPDGRLTILDWKTNARRPRRTWLQARLQTRVYPYLLARAGQHFNAGQPPAPEAIEMVYWFAAHPDAPEHLPYSAEQMRQDEAYLRELIAAISRRMALAADLPQEQRFPLTTHSERCAYCEYRSLCERGNSGGPLADMEDPSDAQDTLLDGFNFEQIGEIRF